MNADINKYIEIRKTLHRNPELKYEEFDTSQLVADHLTNLGYEVTTGIGKTGVKAVLYTNKPGPTIAFRADLDALPISELNDFEHKSQNEGKMHACGHDGHTASLLCAAESLMANKDAYCGNIVIIMQPAEEGGAGAKAMIDDGVLENPRVDKIFGYHNRPGFKQGLVFVKSGSAMGGNTSLAINITGKGGHAAMPHLSHDPVVAGASFVTQVQTVVSRKLSPLNSAAVTVSEFHAGQGHNVIGSDAQLSLSVRSDHKDTDELLVREIEKTLKCVCEQFNCTYELTTLLSIPALVNHRQETCDVIDACQDSFDSDNLLEIDYMPTMGAEDFSFYLLERPGCYFFIGNGEDSAYLHNPHYDFNDNNIAVARQVYMDLAQFYLGRDK
ncbi:M20 metallopeptidase family protein [Vibrio alginolyticus]|uniref:M20 metallopeptidase family protein n=1 Tax=Vibrio alginolyticus TaxID=663 RepID=UPI001BD2BC2A|nr:amidohydrolase [Vibrio alginolyticus]MBS9811363.1 amidohydrolase [Vibrio alginolyticus]MBS9825550.1 amidohydrolase [Vibrio alginolyticus]